MKTFNPGLYILHGEVDYESPCNGQHILIQARSAEEAWTIAQKHLYPKNKTRRVLHANHELEQVEFVLWEEGSR